MNLLNKLKWFLIAIITLVIGYFFGLIILAVIFGIIILITLFFILSLILNKLIDLVKSSFMKNLIKMIFASGITVGILLIFWRLLFTPIILKSSTTGITLIWVISAILFGTLWNFMTIRRRVIYSYKNHLFDYKDSKQQPGIHVWDILFMLIIPTIITVCFNVIYEII